MSDTQEKERHSVALDGELRESATLEIKRDTCLSWRRSAQRRSWGCATIFFRLPCFFLLPPSPPAPGIRVSVVCDERGGRRRDRRRGGQWPLLWGYAAVSFTCKLISVNCARVLRIHCRCTATTTSAVTPSSSSTTPGSIPARCDIFYKHRRLPRGRSLHSFRINAIISNVNPTHPKRPSPSSD